jgi:hypothetical protein
VLLGGFEKPLFTSSLVNQFGDFKEKGIRNRKTLQTLRQCPILEKGPQKRASVTVSLQVSSASLRDWNNGMLE